MQSPATSGTCRKCKGSGKVQTKDGKRLSKCPTCMGTGKDGYRTK